MTPEIGLLGEIGPFRRKEIKKDREKRPLVYGMADRMTNKKLDECLRNGKIKGKDGIIDLRKIEDRVYTSFFVDSEFHKTGENEGFFTFTWSGFIMLIKNVKEITENGEIKFHSEEAVYEIIGPDGKRIGDKEIKGHREASEIFERETKSYVDKIKKELGIQSEE